MGNLISIFKLDIMKFTLQILLFFSPFTFFFSQNYRVFYEYTFIRDSISKENKESEIMIFRYL